MTELKQLSQKIKNFPNIVDKIFSITPSCHALEAATVVSNYPLKDPFSSYRSSRREVFCKKGVLRNFTKFTGEQLCHSVFLLESAR